MTSSRICIHCGAELTSEARFCRRCGQRAAHVSAGSVTEATTRHLETAANRPALGQEFYAQPDTLAYQRSGPMQGGMGTPGAAEPAGQYRKWVFAGLLMIAFISIVSLALAAKLWKHSGDIARPPVVTVPMRPPAPPPPPPPPGLPSGSAPGATAISDALIYPGARTTLRKGNMLQLQTEDSVDQVADWYIAQLKPPKVIRVPGSNAVLKAAEAKVIITAAGNGTSILLKQDHD